MRRLLLGVLAVAAGCNSAERHRAPGRSLGRETERDAAPNSDWTKTQSGKADTLAGFVVLPDGTPARNVPVEIEIGIGQGAPVEVRTDSAGYFRIPGLKPQQSYTLTARAAQNGTRYTGKLYARTGTDKSQRIRIEMAEGAGGPPMPDGPAASGTGMPAPVMPPLPSFTPHDTAIPNPSAAFPPPAPTAGPVETLPPPLVARNPVAEPPTVTPPPPLTVVPRPDLRTQAETPYNSPLTSVPPLRGPDAHAAPTNTRKVSPLGTEFTLIDAAGVPRDFPSGNYVLLDFMTTSCVPCAKSVPLLTAIQERYAGQRLEVVGLCCDPADARTRRARMTEYAKKRSPGYPLLTEPADEPGALLERFKVEAYPTLILLDGDGKEVWRGHPADARELGRYLGR